MLILYLFYLQDGHQQFTFVLLWCHYQSVGLWLLIDWAVLYHQVLHLQVLQAQDILPVTVRTRKLNIFQYIIGPLPVVVNHPAMPLISHKIILLFLKV